MKSFQFLVPQIEYSLGGSSIKGSHVYFMLILLRYQVTKVASEQHLYQTIVQFDKNNSFAHRKLATWSTHDYLFCYCPLVSILFEVLRIEIVYFIYHFSKTNTHLFVYLYRLLLIKIIDILVALVGGGYL